LIGNIDKGVEEEFQIDSKKLRPFQFVNNYEFYKDMNVIDFLRDVGKK
jgi:tyrosyl-tRNA synthetase